MRKGLITVLFAAVVVACTQDTYDKGEGAYSLMRGDFAEANVNGNREVVSITTDDGETHQSTAKVIVR